MTHETETVNARSIADDVSAAIRFYTTHLGCATLTNQGRIVDNTDGEAAHLRDVRVTFRNDIVKGPGGKQILLEDPSGNPLELFQPSGS